MADAKNSTVPLVQNRKSNDKPTKLAGYKASDIAKAPLEPPAADETEDKEAVRNKKVMLMIIGGAATGLMGIFLLMFQFVYLGTFLAAAAVLLVLSGVFLPVR